MQVLEPTAPEYPSQDASETLADGWFLEVTGFDRMQERVIESQFALSNGYLGSRASLAEGYPTSDPGTYIAGVFDNGGAEGAAPELVKAPALFRLRVSVDGTPLALDRGEILEHRRRLDMQHGVLLRDWRQRDPAGRVTRLRTLECVSLADRCALLHRIEVTPENYGGQIRLEMRLDRCEAVKERKHYQITTPVTGSVLMEPLLHLVPEPGPERVLLLRTVGSAIALAFAPDAIPLRNGGRVLRRGRDNAVLQYRTWDAEPGRTYHFDKILAVKTSRDHLNPVAAAREHVQALVDSGPDALLAAHEEAWAQRWRMADVAVDGDQELQRALRLAAFHLIGAANPEDEHVSIGARGLTGEAYKGHVLWDTEIFMLPFFTLTDAQAARSMLMYRYHTLPAARAKAQQFGYSGALYAWESTDTGEEATPSEVIGIDGTVIPILTGRCEHHISADVAYAVWQYWQATQDELFFCKAGAEIILETARFWSSRVVKSPDGRYHINGVVGPDEYHEMVDDNAYTNILARWNLRRGLETAAILSERWPGYWETIRERLQIAAGEFTQWQDIADGIVDGLDRESGLIEQFAGYHELEDVDLAAYEPRSVPMDVLLGHAQIGKTKVIKQPDVLMALYLLQHEFSLDVLEANMRYYDPYTSHGSSLSPGIEAAFAARLGEMAIAERCLVQAAEIDLHDLAGNSAGGAHFAALGGLWQAAVFGFGGVQILDDRLTFEPRLPSRWRGLSFAFSWRGRTLRLRLEAESQTCELTMEAGAPLRVKPDDAMDWVPATAGTSVSGALGARWQIQEGADQ